MGVGVKRQGTYDTDACFRLIAGCVGLLVVQSAFDGKGVVNENTLDVNQAAATRAIEIVIERRERKIILSRRGG